MDDYDRLTDEFMGHLGGNVLRSDADVLMKIPASELHIGNIQSVVSIALLEIKRCLEAISIDKL